VVVVVALVVGREEVVLVSALELAAVMGYKAVALVALFHSAAVVVHQGQKEWCRYDDDDDGGDGVGVRMEGQKEYQVHLVYQVR
jgi:hypothetical protein